MIGDPTQIVDDAMTLIEQQSTELATLRARVEELERERDRWYSVAENAEAEAERNKELREEHARRRVHTEASWHEAVLDRDSWRSRAEAAEARLSEATERAERAEEAFEIANKMRLEAIKQVAEIEVELAAVKAERDEAPRAYIVHAPEDDHYGTGPDRLQFHPLAQHELDNGYRQTPLYALNGGTNHG